MKLRKIMAGIAASAVAASSLAVASSALLYVPEEATHAGCSLGTDSYLVQIYNVGNVEEGKPATDYGIDLSKIDAVRATIKLHEDEFSSFFSDPAMESDWGAIGGQLVMSVNGGDIVQYEDPDDPFADVSKVWKTYNWSGDALAPVIGMFWGVNDLVDAEGNPASSDPLLNDDPEDDGSNNVSTVALGDYTYTITSTGFVNPLSCTTDEWEIDEIGCFQVGMQDYAGAAMPSFDIVKLEVLDTAGNVMIEFDGLGNPTVKADTQAPETEAPETEAPDTDAPETDAPANPDTNKPNTNTGVEGIALVAGIAVLATGAIVVAKKRS